MDIHEALKQLASKTKHLGQYCVRLSYGYSRGIKVISKQNIKVKIALSLRIFTKTGKEITSQTFLCNILGLTLHGNFLRHLECISKVSTQFRAPQPMWPRVSKLCRNLADAL